MNGWLCIYCLPERKVFKSFDGLRKHVISTHLRGGSCPVCGEEYKNVRVHAHQQAIRQDLNHIVLYGLICATKRNGQDFKDKCKGLAEEWCRVEFKGEW